MQPLLTSEPELLSRRFYELETRRDVAELLEVSYPTLIYHLYRIPVANRYVEFTIAKRGGGTRTIRAPVTPLKLLQAKLSDVLYSVYVPRDSTHGFVKARSIVTNADVHKRRKWVLNVDLEEFFPSINFGRVRGLFMSPPYKRSQEVATVLAQICCYQGQLPQGAPSSPVVSNMICSKLDTTLQRLAEELRCDYTRYADDITFSTALAEFPRHLARADRKDPSKTVLGMKLVTAIQDNGFRINMKKVRLQRDNRRQEVTGLVVNRFPNVRKRLYSQVRAMLHAWARYDYHDAQLFYWSLYDKKHRPNGKNPPSFRQVIEGKLSFIRMVRKKRGGKYRKLFKEYLALTGRSPGHATYVLECSKTYVQGSGFFLKGYGLITCAHVLGPSPVAFGPNGATTRHEVRVLYKNEDIDLAILRFEQHGGHSLTKGDPKRAVVGRPVRQLGYPNYAPGQSLHTNPGVIAGLGVRFGARRYATTATIVKGCSGGPLLDTEDQVVGIAVTGLDYPMPEADTEYGVIAVEALDVIVKPDLQRQLGGLVALQCLRAHLAELVARLAIKKAQTGQVGSP